MSADLAGAPDPRARVRALAEDALARGQPTGWFDPLYREARGDPSRVPWADLAPHPALAAWLDQAGDLTGARAVVVGCGLGDDAEAVAGRGARTLAFDVSPAAVEWCRARFPGSKLEVSGVRPGPRAAHSAGRVDYTVGDLLALPPAWRRAFDLVVEVYTVQSLPLALRERALEGVADLAAPGARVVVICRGRDDDEPPAGPPWPLSRRDLRALAAAGLREVSFEDWREPPTPGREPSTVRGFTSIHRCVPPPQASPAASVLAG